MEVGQLACSMLCAQLIQQSMYCRSLDIKAVILNQANSQMLYINSSDGADMSTVYTLMHPSLSVLNSAHLNDWQQETFMVKLVKMQSIYGQTDPG